MCLTYRSQTTSAELALVGYSVCPRGIFCALGRRVTISLDVLFAHYLEVLPAYRSQHIHQALGRAKDAYCQRTDMQARGGLVSIQNQPSILAFQREGLVMRGTVEWVAVLSGLGNSAGARYSSAAQRQLTVERILRIEETCVKWR